MFHCDFDMFSFWQFHMCIQCVVIVFILHIVSFLREIFLYKNNIISVGSRLLSFVSSVDSLFLRVMCRTQP